MTIKIANPEYEADVRALTDCLLQTSIGDVCSYTDLSQAIGRPIQRQRYLLQRARRRAEEAQGALFASVHRLGLKRLPAESYATLGQNARRTIRRKASRAAKSMENGLKRLNHVSDDVLRAVSREQSVLGLIQFTCQDSSLRKQMEKESIDAPTPLAHTAKMLMTALGAEAK